MRLDDGTRMMGRLVLGPLGVRHEGERRFEPATMVARETDEESGDTRTLWMAGGYKITLAGHTRTVAIKGRPTPHRRSLRQRGRMLAWRLRGSPPILPSSPGGRRWCLVLPAKRARERE